MNYASPFDPYRSVPFGKEFLEVSPESTYQLWGQGFGAAPWGNRRFYNYAQALQPWYRNDYYNAAALNNGLYWSDYLDRIAGCRSPTDFWNELSPQEKGIQGGGRSRWLM